MSLQALFVLFVQTSVLLGVALVACAFLRRSPAIRMLVCKTALVATVAMALASPWLRERQRPVVPLDTVPLFLQTTVIEPPSIPKEEHPNADDFSPDAHHESHDVDPLAIGTAVYQYGVLLMLLGLGIGYAKLFLLRATTQAVTDQPILEAVQAVSKEFQVQVPAVRAGTKVSTVFVAGILRPTLFLPDSWASSQDEATILSVVRHEVAHIAAKDLQWSLAYRVIHILLWPQVLLLALKKPFCTASEELCDMRVLESGSEPKAYASALLNLRDQLKANRRRVPIGIGAVTIRSNFGLRIQQILSYQPGRGARLSRKVVVFGALGTCLCAGVVANVFAASKAGTVGRLASVQNIAELRGTTEVTISTPNGSAFLGKAWVVFSDQRGVDSAEPIAVNHGRVKVELEKYQGAFRISLVAMMPGYGITFKRIIPTDKPVKTMTMLRTTTMVGQAIGPDKQPVANAPVVLKMLTLDSKEPENHEFLLPPPLIATVLATRTDAKGRFTMPSLPQGCSARVDVVDSKYAAADLWETRKKLGTDPITNIGVIKLTRAAEIRGIVRLNGKPAPGIRLGAQENNSGGSTRGYWATAITDANGRYVLGRLNESVYNVALDLDSKIETAYTAKAHEHVQALAGRCLMGMDFDLISGGVVEGTVTGPDGKPVANAQLGIYGPAHPQSSAWVQTMFTGADGKYRFHVPPGRQYVYLMSQAESNHGEDITVANGATTAVNFQMK